MPSPAAWAAAGVGGLLAAAFGYWLFVITEGMYLGQRVVTWLYDASAARYDAIKQYDPDMEATFLGRPLSTVLKSVPAPLVLDVGTGTGRLPGALLQQPTFRGQIVGIDASGRMLRGAADRLAGHEHRTTLIWRDARRLPFPDGVFDAVTCLEMLEFTPDPRAQLTEAVRALRPGGVLVTTRRRGWQARLMPGKFYSADAFRALLTSLGIEHVEIQAWQMDYDLVWGVKARREPSVVRHRLDVLICPKCASAQWTEGEKGLQCGVCRTRYCVAHGIIDMHG
jgi:ubiquinone/menaquinone biosynthesis C-methylase UbiE